MNQMKESAMPSKPDKLSPKSPVGTKTVIGDDEIDEALIETFPASDPPQWTLGTDHQVDPPSKSRKARRKPWHS
jgi:hypothetical protein